MITIDGYPIDVAVLIDPAFTNDATSHPVEEGSDITDHVRARPIRLTLEGIVSDTPIGEVADARSEGLLPSDEAYFALKLINDNRQPVTISTDRFGDFDNMVMLSLSAPQRSETGDALRFVATFQQIKLVTNDRATIPVAVPRAKRKVNRGARAAKPTPNLNSSIWDKEKTDKKTSTLWKIRAAAVDATN